MQICLLLGICIWLIYQVKSSYEKKAAFDKSSQISGKVQNGNEIPKLGRKDLNPQLEERGIKDDMQRGRRRKKKTGLRKNQASLKRMRI